MTIILKCKHKQKFSNVQKPLHADDKATQVHSDIINKMQVKVGISNKH